MTRKTKQRIGSTLGGAVATAALPFGAGVYDYRILAGAAAVGAVGGFFGVDVAGKVKGIAEKRKAPLSVKGGGG